jgi:hypothetical protein
MVPLSGVFAIVSTGAATQLMLPVSVTVSRIPLALKKLVAVALAVLLMTLQLVGVTALTTAVLDDCGVKSPKLQFNTRVPGDCVLLMLQPVLDVLQLRPSGKTSLTLTAVAVPLPVFVTRIVKVAVWPAVMVPPSGVFAIVSRGSVICTGSALHALEAEALFASPL